MGTKMLYVKDVTFVLNRSTVRALTDKHTHRETHTDGTDSITSTADVGGKNNNAMLEHLDMEYFRTD